MPALAIKIFKALCVSRNFCANASIELGSIRSRGSTSTPAMSAVAAFARSTERAPTITVAPAADNARVVCSPIPECPPVIIATFPLRSMSFTTSSAVVCASKPDEIGV